MSGFIEEGDWEGLREYYLLKIKTTSEIIDKSDFALENLSKIKVKEVKAILAAKLMMAQNLGLEFDIKVEFEVNADIEAFPIDSVALVRIVGIIMDNAIEELTELKEGRLLVSCLKRDWEIVLIVKNTCGLDVSKNQGILSEIIGNYPNITLETDIAEDGFIQKLKMAEVF
jgi:two-component system sensor histidine kinase AgrC